ncbi:hypothetical protein [Acetobacter orientalis]|uniref:MFS transporter n=1 Tax=Acetobacter orientalis TaxID=146474 RepID=A0A2Z5ZLV0_9PROT|nr:MFS transporter [Acetobacter orientalis]
MDIFTQSLLLILLPAAVFTLIAGLSIGPVMTRLAKWRESLERN